jgi:GAF domain-containing protein
LGKQKSSEVEKAIRDQTPVVSEDDKNLKLTIPIMLRNQPIGAIGIEAGENKHQWSADEISLAQEISEQFALAAESIRLLDETQRRAARERLVAEITTKIRANNDPQTMVQTAAKELRDALQAKRTQVIFQPASTHKDQEERGEE